MRCSLPQIAACRPRCARFGTHLTGELAVDLGALLELFRDGTLVVPGPTGQPLHVFALGGSPLSGTHQLRGVDLARGAVVTHRLPADVTFGCFFFDLARRARALRTVDVEGWSLDAVARAVGTHVHA